MLSQHDTSLKHSSSMANPERRNTPHVQIAPLGWIVIVSGDAFRNTNVWLRNDIVWLRNHLSTFASSQDSIPPSLFSCLFPTTVPHRCTRRSSLLAEEAELGNLCSSVTVRVVTPLLGRHHPRVWKTKVCVNEQIDVMEYSPHSFLSAKGVAGTTSPTLWVAGLISAVWVEVIVTGMVPLRVASSTELEEISLHHQHLQLECAIAVSQGHVIVDVTLPTQLAAFVVSLTLQAALLLHVNIGAIGKAKFG